MVAAVDTVPDSARLTAASALQKLLPELVGSSLDKFRWMLRATVR